MSGPRILTFNFHEPYLCLMAKTGLDFTVGLYEGGELARPWQTQFRAIPPNMTLVEESVWRRDLEQNRFDVVIAHNEANAINIFKTQTPGLLVCHNRKTFLSAGVPKDKPEQLEQFEELLLRLLERFTLVFISDSKRADYAVPGKVILPGIDVEEYGGYTGETAEILRVGNMMRARNLMFDVDFQEAVCEGFPYRVVGHDPDIPGAQPSGSFAELLAFYRTRRCLLHVSRQEYEDGYNLATLEAMACGMPVVSLGNLTSPITDGLDGFISFDKDVLRERVAQLLEDRDLALEIGAKGRETVAKRFSIGAFAEKWRAAIEEAAEQSSRFTGTHQAARERGVPEAPRLNLVLHYLSSPITTGRYFEQAARKRHHVVTAGLRCPEIVFPQEQFHTVPPPYLHHNVDMDLDGTCQEIKDHIEGWFKPELYLWVDSGVKNVPSDIADWEVPKACYLVDSHIAPDLRLRMAKHFDYTFLAQKAQVDLFKRAGIPNVKWLPLACWPDLHRVGQLERAYDVAYVGNVASDVFERRKRLLEDVGRAFPNNFIGMGWPEDMARIYAQSKIVVNACVNRDVNMRVFEAMASGALLITDEADGLEDLFEDGKHLVIYQHDEEVPRLIARYLDDDEARERIAAAGKQEVLARHTYDHRLNKLLNEVLMREHASQARSYQRSSGHARTGVAAQSSVQGMEGESRFEEGGYFRNRRPELAQYVPPTVRRILDVGCGAGDFGLGLKEQGVEEVIGLELEERAWKQAKEVLDDALLGSIETVDLPFEAGHFDCVTFADVLEHLVDPVAALRKVTPYLTEDGVIVISIPNVRFFEVVEMLAEGQWTYANAGILDRTHLRFFTAVEMRKLIEDAGLEVVHMEPLCSAGPEDLPRRRDGSVRLGRLTLNDVTDEDYEGLLTFQYVVVAGKPGIDRLGKARQALQVKENELAVMLAECALGVDEAERLTLQATAHARLGRLDRAEKLYRDVLEILPDDPKATAELGILLVGMNRAHDAAPLLEKAIEMNAGADRAVGALGLVRLMEGRSAEAFDLLRGALEGSYENRALLPSLVGAAAELDRLAEIEDLVRGFADFYPGNQEIACNYAELLTILGRHEEARDRLDTVLILDPSNEKARALLAGLEDREPDDSTGA